MFKESTPVSKQGEAKINKLNQKLLHPKGNDDQKTMIPTEREKINAHNSADKRLISKIDPRYIKYWSKYKKQHPAPLKNGEKR